MKLKFLTFLIFDLITFQIQAQSDESQSPSIQENQIDAFEKLLEQFDLSDSGNGIFMDTMIFRQFGGDNFGNGELDSVMKEMMEMMELQMQQFDFNNMPGFDHFFEDFDLDNLQPDDFFIDPDSSDSDDNSDKLKRKKKRKTYKL